jgi:SAM-dependent methyltransferase
MKNKMYSDHFYDCQSIGSVNSAMVVLPKVLAALPQINSVADFGCGVGAWLSVINKLGVSEICGYDGPWVNKDMLMIPKESFLEIEFDKDFYVNRKYDLAISLEVAEHIPMKYSSLFVNMLVSASDIILFSAAIPFQGGVEHINEQWPEYWYNLFAKHGYIAMDFLRNQIWNERDVEFWYKQNIMLYVKKEVIKKIKIIPFKESKPLSYVHPQQYLSLLDRKSLRQLWQIVLRRTWKKIFR